MKSNFDIPSEHDPANQPAPPLSTRHFLYWTAGVAMCLGLFYGNAPPKPRNLLGYLLVSSNVVYCIVAGGAIAFLIWSLTQGLFRRPAPLNQPGAKYVAILGLTIALALIKTRIVSWIMNVTVTEPFDYELSAVFWRWYFSDLVYQSLAAFVFVCGVFWVRDGFWRVGLVASLLLALHSAYTSYWRLDLRPLNNSSALANAIEEWCLLGLHFVPFIAAIASLVVDRRGHARRDWTHYFGVLLCGLLLIEYLLVPINR